MPTKPNPDTTILLRHDFKAERERVFSAFLDAKTLQTIWSSEAYRIIDMTLVPQVGKGWRMAMRNEESGQVLHCSARFVEIVRPSKIVWLNKWEDGPLSQPPETRVTLEFTKTADGTRVSLTHEFFPDSTTRDHHAEGWGEGFDNLEQLLGRDR